MEEELCETCKMGYDKHKIGFCSSSFHCCRDCKWDAGRLIEWCEDCKKLYPQAYADLLKEV